MLLLSVSVLFFVPGCNKQDSGLPADLYRVETDVETLRFPCDGSTKTFTFDANADWQIHSPSTLLTFTPGKGTAGGQTVSVTLPPQPEDGFTEYESSIVIRCGSLSDDYVVRKFISIVQDARIAPEREPGIWSAADWNEFVDTYNSATAENPDPDVSKWEVDGVVNIWKDIDFGGTKIKSLGGQSSNNKIETYPDDIAFNGIIDGNGHRISGSFENSTDKMIALVSRLGTKGIIRNLDVDVNATSTFGESNGHLAAVVAFSLSSEGSYIDNCNSYGTLIHPEGAKNSTRVGGIVAYGRCPISNCTNYAEIEAHSNRVGGIAGAGGGTYEIKNSVNKGAISTNTAGAQIGGIIGQLNGQNLNNCSNEGEVTAVANGATELGGLAGEAKGSNANVFGDCSNIGQIILLPLEGIVSDGAMVGGLAGNLNVKGGKVIVCTNGGMVKNGVENVSICAGGIAGKVSQDNVEISGCSNTEKGQVVSVCLAGGIIGQTEKTALKIMNCTNNGAVSLLDGVAGAGSWFGGIAGKVPSMDILQGCVNGGTVKGVAGDDSNIIGKE